MISFFKKTFSGLSKTRKKISSLFAGFVGKSYLDDTDIEKLEEALLGADLGWELTDMIVDRLSRSDSANIGLDDRFLQCVKEYLSDLKPKHDLKKVIILVGINGTGKTTSAAKLGGLFSNQGEAVSLVAADTYRAAAVEQLRIWSKRLKLHLTAKDKSSDPASVAYEGVSNGMDQSLDRIIIDTSGRLHTYVNLMKELEKIYRVVQKITDDIDTLITIDANTGQNGLEQAREFAKYIPISGVILTKMDGTARGGIAMQIMKELNLPVYYIGVGEQVDDLIPFDQESYISGLISSEKEDIDE